MKSAVKLSSPTELLKEMRIEKIIKSTEHQSFSEK
jgi:hypothetical protein